MIPSPHRRDSKEQLETLACKTTLHLSRDSITKSPGKDKISTRTLNKENWVWVCPPAENEGGYVHPVTEFSELEVRTPFPTQCLQSHQDASSTMKSLKLLLYPEVPFLLLPRKAAPVAWDPGKAPGQRSQLCKFN